MVGDACDEATIDDRGSDDDDDANGGMAEDGGGPTTSVSDIIDAEWRLTSPTYPSQKGPRKKKLGGKSRLIL